MLDNPKKEKGTYVTSIRTTVYFEPELLKAMDKEAEKLETSRSDLINTILRERYKEE